MQLSLFYQRFKFALAGLILCTVGLLAAIFISSMFMALLFIGICVVWIGGFIGFMRIVSKSNDDARSIERR